MTTTNPKSTSMHSADGEVQWREILGTVFRQKKLIATVTLAGLATVSVLTWFEPPIYRASAKLLVQTQRARIPLSPSEARPTVDRMSDQEINAVVALIKSLSLVREVLAPYQSELEGEEERTLIGLASDVITFPLRVPGILYRTLHGLPEPSPFDRLVQKTLAKIEVSAVKRSHLIEVAYVSRDPERAARFVNDLIRTYITRYASLSQAVAGQDFFRSQREILGKRLEDAQAELRAFREEVGTALASEDASAIREQLADLEKQRAEEQARLAELEAREAFLTHSVLSNPDAIGDEPQIAANPTVQFLKSRLLDLELERSEMLSRYAPGSQFLSDLERRIADTRRLKRKEEEAIVHLMIAETRSELATVRARVASLQERIRENQERLMRLENVSGEQARLEQQLAAARESYMTYLKKEEQARFSKALDESRIVNLSVAEPAETPTEPEGAHQLETILLGTILSLLLGIALAFLREQLDPTVKTRIQAERLTGLPVITEIPS